MGLIGHLQTHDHHSWVMYVQDMAADESVHVLQLMFSGERGSGQCFFEFGVFEKAVWDVVDVEINPSLYDMNATDLILVSAGGDTTGVLSSKI